MHHRLMKQNAALLAASQTYTGSGVQVSPDQTHPVAFHEQKPPAPQNDPWHSQAHLDPRPSSTSSREIHHIAQKTAPLPRHSRWDASPRCFRPWRCPAPSGHPQQLRSGRAVRAMLGFRPFLEKQRPCHRDQPAHQSNPAAFLVAVSLHQISFPSKAPIPVKNVFYFGFARWNFTNDFRGL